MPHFWIYLVHLPLAIWLPGQFSTLVLPAGIKILMLLVTYVVGFVSYDLFVRSTRLGSTLSGRRYPVRSSARPDSGDQRAPVEGNS
jgi:glucans biosynthesis protein C